VEQPQPRRLKPRVPAESARTPGTSPSVASRARAAFVVLFAAAASLGALGALGCAAPVKNSPPPVPAAKAEGEDRPFHLEPPLHLAKADDAVVRIINDVACTGTLIAEDLVLTAHHCVSARDDQGRTLRRDLDPEDISIELGGDYLPWGEVQVRAIVSPDCGYTAGDGDIAILVLSRRLIGIPTLTPRLEEEPDAREPVVPVGFGRCALSRDGIQRERRLGGNVDAVAPSHFVAVASICPGDSGGPALSAGRGDVIGVISASVMDGDENTAGTSHFTRLDVWRELFSAAREIADGASSSELPPFRSCSR